MIKLLELIPDDKSIWLQPDGFCLVDGAPSLHEAYFPYSDEGDKVEKINAFFDQTLENATGLSVIVANDVPAIVPQQLAEKCNLTKMLELQYEADIIAETCDTAVDDYRLVYYVNKKEQSILSQLSVNKRYFSLYQLMFDFIQKNPHPNTVLLLSIQDKYTDLMLVKDNHLTLVNRYPWRCPEDVLYTLLNVKSQYQLADDTALWLHTNEGHSSVDDLLAKYCADIVYVE